MVQFLPLSEGVWNFVKGVIAMTRSRTDTPVDGSKAVHMPSSDSGVESHNTYDPKRGSVVVSVSPGGVLFSSITISCFMAFVINALTSSNSVMSRKRVW